jgi:hypothetical protein
VDDRVRLFSDFILWLNGTPFSVYLHESELTFPLTEAIHLVGVVSMMLWVDLPLVRFRSCSRRSSRR